MPIAYIGIGSNLGDRQANCKRAVELLKSDVKSDGGVKSLVKSKWYNTKPLMPDARCQMPDFINGVVKIETTLSPIDLLLLVQRIEAEMGRVRTGKKWEPRTIDLDILFYDDLILDMPTLKIPHPELHKRTFVLEPMCDIAPMFMHPVFNRTIKQLMEAL